MEKTGPKVTVYNWGEQTHSTGDQAWNLCQPLRSDFSWYSAPQQTEGFKKRWFTLDERRLMYFKDPLVGAKPTFCRTDLIIQCWWCVCVQDAYARGEVFIGSEESGYSALPGLPPNIQSSHWQFGITIVTPDRKFLFACETEPSQKEWISAFETVINRPMLPQEYAGEPKFLLFVHPQTLRNLTFLLHVVCSGGVFQTQTMIVCRICTSNGKEDGIWSLHLHSPHHATPPRDRPTTVEAMQAVRADTVKPVWHWNQ